MRTLVRFGLMIYLFSQLLSPSVTAQEAKVVDPPKDPAATEQWCATATLTCRGRPVSPMPIPVFAPIGTSVEELNGYAKQQLMATYGSFRCNNGTAPEVSIIEDWHVCSAAYAPSDKAGPYRVECGYCCCNGIKLIYIADGCSYAEAICNANKKAHAGAELRGTKIRCRQYCDRLQTCCSPCR